MEGGGFKTSMHPNIEVEHNKAGRDPCDDPIRPAKDRELPKECLH